jgi:signal transduction histidine kinase
MLPPPAPAGAFTWLPAPLARAIPTKSHLVWSLVLVPVCFFVSGVTVAFLDMAGRPPSLDLAEVEIRGITILGLLFVFGMPWLVVLRDVASVAICLSTAALPVLMPYDALTPLVVLPAVYVARSARVIAVCTAASAVAVGASTTRNLLLAEEYRVFTVTHPGTGERSMMPVAGYVLIGLLSLAVSVGVGLWRRSTATSRAVADLTEQHTTQTAVLQDRLTRQSERDDIAREVHDTVAHSLSQIALQASVLESSPDAGPEVREASARIRAAARQAGTERRGVLTTLRTGADGLKDVSFDDLGALLLNLHDQGARINSTVFVSECHTAPTVLARACYRIVQESVTNALKHAPVWPIDIVLRGAPATGVTVTVRNPISCVTATVPGTGSGLAGMTERAAVLGGTFTAATVDGRWVTEAWLPWNPAGPLDGAVRRPTL